MSEIAKVEELVAPLGNNAQGIFEERHDDEKSPDGREVTG